MRWLNEGTYQACEIEYLVAALKGYRPADGKKLEDLPLGIQIDPQPTFLDSSAKGLGEGRLDVHTHNAKNGPKRPFDAAIKMERPLRSTKTDTFWPP